MAEDKDTAKRSKKSRYVSNNKKRRLENNLTAGMRGVFITCNEKKERYSVSEAYNILNEYADRMYGKEAKISSSNNTSSEDEDIEKAVNKEKEKMKCDFQRFQSVKCGAKNVLFIKTSLPNDEDPSELVHSILFDVLEKGLNRSRNCMRFLPVSTCCYASIKEIQSTAENLFKDSLLAPDTKPYKFCVVYKARNNDGIHRDDVIATLAQIVLHSGMDHTVDLHNPDITICVEIVRTICCLSVVKDFHKLKKYNIQEIQKCGQSKPTISSSEIASKDSSLVDNSIEPAPEDEQSKQNESEDNEESKEDAEGSKIYDIGKKDSRLENI